LYRAADLSGPLLFEVAALVLNYVVLWVSARVPFCRKCGYLWPFHNNIQHSAQYHAPHSAELSPAGRLHKSLSPPSLLIRPADFHGHEPSASGQIFHTLQHAQGFYRPVATALSYCFFVSPYAPGTAYYPLSYRAS